LGWRIPPGRLINRPGAPSGGWDSSSTNEPKLCIHE